jgi:CRISPR associated protein Cas1
MTSSIASDGTAGYSRLRIVVLSSDDWKVFGSRQSGLATVTSPRRATNPANAVLNYLYALGELEARLALLTVGLDPGLGFLHVDQGARDSAALDLLEAIRPDVDAYTLRLIQQRTWTRRDFAELRDGTCRIPTLLTHELAETLAVWARLLAPIAELIAATLADAAGGVGSLPTPLTQSNRSAGRQRQRKRTARQPKTEAKLPVTTCASCGVTLADASRRVCNTCLPERRSTAGTIGRRASKDAAGYPEVASDRNARRAAALCWEADAPSEARDRRALDQQIRVGLRNVSVELIARATGLSASYCARIRNGPVTPHPRHWAGLRALVDMGAEGRDAK